ncbi:MAG TPA: PHP domain-containing protein [Syntrophomonadaceae bacterium]|nr:PHP domain-containing protein [Syntrophomonadaceae bacterium]
MEFYGDYHVHSRNSDGRQQKEDIVKAARNRGLKEVAITDHGPLVAGIGVKNTEKYTSLAQEIEGAKNDEEIRVYVGAEANIRGLDGKLDLDEAAARQLDILIAGLHPYTLPSTLKDGMQLFARNSLRHLGREQRKRALNNNTKACVAAIYANPTLDILSHPGMFFQVDIIEVAQACVQNKVLFEINCGHEHPSFSDIMEANRIGVDFIVNSDAHFPESVGNLEYGQRAIKQLEIEPERVINLGCRGGLKIWGKKARGCIYL